MLIQHNEATKSGWQTYHRHLPDCCGWWKRTNKQSSRHNDETRSSRVACVGCDGVVQDCSPPWRHSSADQCTTTRSLDETWATLSPSCHHVCFHPFSSFRLLFLPGHSRMHLVQSRPCVLNQIPPGLLQTPSARMTVLGGHFGNT